MESIEFNQFIKEIKGSNPKLTINYSEYSKKSVEEFYKSNPEFPRLPEYIYDVRMSALKKHIYIKLSFYEGSKVVNPPINDSYYINVGGDVEKSIREENKIKAGLIFKNTILDILDWFRYKINNDL